MAKTMIILAVPFVVVSLCFGVLSVAGDIVTAASYGPPYLPIKCNDSLPEDGMFAAVSKEIWADGAACGQSYLMTCLSGPNHPCKNGTIVRFVVVDLCRTEPCQANVVLAWKPFGVISKVLDAKLNAEFVPG